MSDARDNPLHSATRGAIDEIASDNTSGAAEILRRSEKVFSLLNAAQNDFRRSNVEQARSAVLETCIALVRAQPDMSYLLRLASAALSAAKSGTTAIEVLESVETAALRYTEDARQKAHASALHAASLIGHGSSVLTHSRSSTVVEAFIEAHRAGKDFSVVATESRPVFEGRKLARTLAGEGIPVRLTADAGASLMLDDVDFVLIGADKITPKSLVNKIGTRMIVLAARELRIPVYAACDTLKFIGLEYRDRGRNQAAGDELWPDAPDGIEVVNCYFEPTPLAYFDGIVTEDGALSADEAARRADAVSIDALLLDAIQKRED